jgi:hypothetical protein
MQNLTVLAANSKDFSLNMLSLYAIDFLQIKNEKLINNKRLSEQ